MRKAKDIVGLPIIEIETGRQAGTAKDFLVDSSWMIQGVLLETKHWFSSPKYIAWDELISVGEDAITIPNEVAILQLKETSGLFCMMSGANKIMGLPMITINGHQLGIVEDVYFGEKMDKKIIGYELTDGFISDLQEGRKWLPAPNQITIGEKAIIVPVHCEHNLEKIVTTTDE